MSNYLLDTNILLLLLRQDSRWETVETRFDLPRHRSFISVVTLGELQSLGLRNRWGVRRMAQIDQLKHSFVLLDINVDTIIDRYGQIDAFSQGKHPTLSLQTSARNMGKNDLWIAATASVYGLSLITADLDFNHLSPDLLNLELVDLAHL
jgi:tRNA(fMet)-specific endonuclease VapC